MELSLNLTTSVLSIDFALHFRHYVPPAMCVEKSFLFVPQMPCLLGEVAFITRSNSLAELRTPHPRNKSIFIIANLSNPKYSSLTVVILL